MRVGRWAGRQEGATPHTQEDGQDWQSVHSSTPVLYHTVLYSTVLCSLNTGAQLLSLRTGAKTAQVGAPVRGLHSTVQYSTLQYRQYRCWGTEHYVQNYTGIHVYRDTPEKANIVGCQALRDTHSHPIAHVACYAGTTLIICTVSVQPNYS